MKTVNKGKGKNFHLFSRTKNNERMEESSGENGREELIDFTILQLY